MPNTIYTLTFDQEPDAGFFQFRFGVGVGGTDIVYVPIVEADAVVALEFSTSIGVGDVAVTLSPDRLIMYIEFIGAMANTNYPTFELINGDGIGSFLRKTTTFTISNQVAGTAGTPHTLRLNKPAAGTDTGTYRLFRTATPMSGFTAWNATAAELQTSITGAGQSYTVVDMGTYFQLTRNLNGSNGTWTVNNAIVPSEPIGDLTVVSMVQTQEGGPDVLSSRMMKKGI